MTETHLLNDDGTFPNNATLPLIIYRQAVDISAGDAAAQMEELLHRNGWGNSWRNGIYNYHHYHSTAHEVLGIYKGEAEVQFGGPEGIITNMKAGDVVAIPAGVAHKNLQASADFACVGAYPPGQHFDMNYGKPGERPQTDQQIAKVPLPESDPIDGNEGELSEYWHN